MKRLQIAALTATLFALVISIVGVFYAADQIELLRELLTETKHQALMAELDTLTDQFEKGSPFSIAVDSCSFIDDKIEFMLDVFDNKGMPSTVKFEIIIDYIIYSVGGEVGNENYEIINPQQIIFEPGIQKKTELSLESMFDITKEIEDKELYLSTQYRFAPYFDKQGTVISHYFLVTNGDLLLGFKKDTVSGNWNQITNNKNIVCK